MLREAELNHLPTSGNSSSFGPLPLHQRLLTLPIREANLSLRIFISSFSWFFCCWTAGSTLRSRGTRRLGFTVTLGMVPAGQQLVRLLELNPDPGAPQLLHPEAPGRGLPKGVTSQPLRLLKPTTQDRQAMVPLPPAWEREGLVGCSEQASKRALEGRRVAGGRLLSQPEPAGD